MNKARLTGKRAVWTGLLGTPVLLIAAITLIGVTTGSAGPSTPATPAATTQTANGVTAHVTAFGSGKQTLEELKAYWTPEAMANAKPYPMTTSNAPSSSDGSVQTIPQTNAPFMGLRMTEGGGVDTTSLPTSQSAGALTEPFHAAIPYTQWQWFGRYLRNVPAGSPNLPVSAQHKMFFTQNGSNFVCSSSSIGPDAVWTAGHCVSDGSNTFSTNALFCPSFDSAQGGINPTAGCWGSDTLFVLTTFHNTGDLDYDFGGANASNNGTVQAGMIGNYTGWLGIGLCFTDGPCNINANWVAMGYPQAAPFAGGKLETCASSLGYIDAATAGGLDSWSIGCDMTGGSSGGPWILGFGRFGGQPGGAALNWVVGHNDWRHVAVTNELNSPQFNCRALAIWNAINGQAVACP
jgi:V8-like Glu-specific endopeptidase